jgi:hypothetical protein
MLMPIRTSSRQYNFVRRTYVVQAAKILSRQLFEKECFLLFANSYIW